MIFSVEKWLDWKFDIPPLDEQKRIAAVLKAWDDSIEFTAKLIENSETQRRFLIRHLLTPGANATSGSAGKEWSHTELGKLGSFYSGVTYSPKDVVNSSGLLILRSSNVQDGLIRLDDNVYVRDDVKVSTLTQAGDILICVRNGSRSLIGKTAPISTASSNCAHGAFMSLFRPNSEPDFCRHLFATEHFEKLVAQNLGATINSINTSNMRHFSFLLPPKSQWPEIGQVLSTQDRSIELLRTQHANLLAQKKGLMQQLLTGKRRLKMDKEIAA